MYTMSDDREVHTVSQASNVDLAKVQCGCHSNIEGTLRNVISTIGDSNSQRTLEQEEEGGIYQLPAFSSHS